MAAAHISPLPLPTVTEIQFLHKIYVGFPIAPAVFEVNEEFDQDSSTYLWEFAESITDFDTGASDTETETDSETVAKKPKTDDSAACRNWKPCDEGTDLIFTPGEALLGSILKLTVTPWNAAKSRQGSSVSATTRKVQTNPQTRPPLYEERLARMDAKSQKHNSFRVMTYNVLAENLATRDKFKDSPKESLAISYRLPLLGLEVKAFSPDILCLQEVDTKHFKGYFQKYLGKFGLKGIHFPKPGQRAAVAEGVAIFYNERKFEHISTHSVQIYDHMKTLAFHKEVEDRSPDLLSRVSKRNQVLLVAILKLRKVPAKFFIVATTHLYFSPDAPGIKLLQAMTCIDFVQRRVSDDLKQTHPNSDTAVIFCGDLNTLPTSSKFLTSGKISKNDSDWTSKEIKNEAENLEPGINWDHTLGLQNSHPNHEISTITTDFQGCIDYMLTSKDAIHLVKNYPPPSIERVAELCGSQGDKLVSLPNLQAPSDHLSLVADFELQLQE